MLNFLKSQRTEKAPDATTTSKRLAGPGFIILNMIRAMNIIALLAGIAASLIMVVKTFTASKFFFFDGASHIITALASMFLVISECSLFRRWYEKNWPPLSNSHGFNFLGLAMIVIGNLILGNLNKSATSQESLGLPFWRMVIGAGCVVFALGFLNLLADIIFSNRKLGITARQVRSKGAVAISEKESFFDSSSSVRNPYATSFAASSKYSQAEPVRPSPVRRFMHQARMSMLPSYRAEAPPYASSPPQQYPSSPVKCPSPSRPGPKNDSGSSGGAAGGSASSPDRPLNISAPMNVNPQFAHLVQANLSRHPTRRPDGSF